MSRTHTLPFSCQIFACCLERTLQSKMALSASALRRATARPIFTCSSNGMRRSWNGCEDGLQMNIQHGKDNVVVVVDNEESND